MLVAAGSLVAYAVSLGVAATVVAVAGRAAARADGGRTVQRGRCRDRLADVHPAGSRADGGAVGCADLPHRAGLDRSSPRSAATRGRCCRPGSPAGCGSAPSGWPVAAVEAAGRGQWAVAFAALAGIAAMVALAVAGSGDACCAGPQAAPVITPRHVAPLGAGDHRRRRGRQGAADLEPRPGPDPLPELRAGLRADLHDPADRDRIDRLPADDRRVPGRPGRRLQRAPAQLRRHGAVADAAHPGRRAGGRPRPAARLAAGRRPGRRSR